MTAVYYSLVLTAESTVYQNQWIRSISSLRRFNRTIPVYLFLLNDPTPAILEAAERYEVAVHRLGNYRDRLVELAAEEGAALSSVPTLHKLLPLGHFDDPAWQILFLDCDTVLFRDVASLFTTYTEHRFYAREESHSKRSVFFQYRPSATDEDVLSRIAAQAGASPVPPYNSGVMLLNRGLAAELFALRTEFLQFAWRLTMGALTSDRISISAELQRALANVPVSRLEEGIEYPSTNFWILEQLAFWLTLGKVQNLSHGMFNMADVLQNGEFMIYRSYKTKGTVVHYFSRNEAFFLRDAGIPWSPDS